MNDDAVRNILRFVIVSKGHVSTGTKLTNNIYFLRSEEYTI